MLLYNKVELNHAVVASYQKYMKGVDLMDQMIGYYVIQHHWKKWWRNIFHYLMMASALTNPEVVKAEWPNVQDFMEEIIPWLVREVRSWRDPAANPHPAPSAGRDDIVKMYKNTWTCTECSMGAAAGKRRGTTRHGCQQCQQPVHLGCVCIHFHRMYNLWPFSDRASELWRRWTMARLYVNSCVNLQVNTTIS